MIALAIFALPICIADVKYHRIPNIYLIWMFYINGVELIFNGFTSINIFIYAVIVLCLLHGVAGIGMGDVKLVILMCLATHLARSFQLWLFICAIFACASILVLLEFLLSGRIRREIALAPAIFMATALYLGARSSGFLQEYAHALVNSW